MRHLFHCWPQVVQRFEAKPTIALFLDFDGTLVPIQARPEDVWLDDDTRRTLLRLVRSPRFRVWIVSGRRRADVRARVRVPGIRYLGLHGWEGRDAGAITEEARKAVACAKSWLASPDAKCARRLARRQRPDAGRFTTRAWPTKAFAKPASLSKVSSSLSPTRCSSSAERKFGNWRRGSWVTRAWPWRASYPPRVLAHDAGLYRRRPHG